MWEYYWGHTAAQIEIMEIDAPMVCYKKHDDDNYRSSGLKPGDRGYRPNPKKLESAVERWKKRKEEREKRGFRLDKLLETGEKVPIGEENT